MKIELKNRDSQRLLAALRTVDKNESVKIDGKTRLTLAININRLMSHISALELTVQHLQRETDPDDKDRALNTKIMKEVDEMLGETAEFDLLTLSVKSLRLEDNNRITGDTISSLTPMLTDLEESAQ